MEMKFVIIICAAAAGLLGAFALVYDCCSKVEPNSISAEFTDFTRANKFSVIYNYFWNYNFFVAYHRFSHKLEELIKSSDANKLFDGYEYLKTKQDVLAQFKIAYLNAVPNDKINEVLLQVLKNYTMFISDSANINEADEKDLIRFKRDVKNFFMKNEITLKSADVETIFGSKLLSSHLKSLTISDELPFIDSKLIETDLSLLTELKLIHVKNLVNRPRKCSHFSNIKKLEIIDGERIRLGFWGFNNLESLKVSGKNIDLGCLDKFTNLKELFVESKDGKLSPEIKDATCFSSNQHRLKVKVTGIAKPLSFKVPAKKIKIKS